MPELPEIPPQTEEADAGRLDRQVQLTNRFWYGNWVCLALSIVAGIPGTNELSELPLGIRLPSTKAWPLLVVVSLLLSLAAVRQSRSWFEHVVAITDRPRPAALFIPAGRMSKAGVFAWLALPTLVALLLPASLNNWQGMIGTLGPLLFFIAMLDSLTEYSTKFWTVQSDDGRRLTLALWLRAVLKVIIAVVFLYTTLVSGYATLTGHRMDMRSTLWILGGVMFGYTLLRFLGGIFFPWINALGLRWGFSETWPEHVEEALAAPPSARKLSGIDGAQRPGEPDEQLAKGDLPSE